MRGKPSPTEDRRAVISWALYDWANSAFATTVIAGFFPVFFKQFWSTGVDVTVSTFHLGTANSAASAIVAVCAPILGAIADRGGAKRRFLWAFALLGIITTAALALVAKGHWEMAVLFYVLGNIGFSGGNIFYDALLVSVAGSERVHAVSALGFSLGYLGGGLLFALNIAMVLTPHTFGLADSSAAVQASFLSVAVWWAVFSIPIFRFVREPREAASGSSRAAVTNGMRQLRETFHKVRSLRVVALFLVGYWLYIDGVDTIIRTAVDYGLSLGFSAKSLMLALLITQFVGFPAAIVFGRIGERLGAKIGLYIGIGVYVGITVWGYFMQRESEFYLLAVLVGLVQGGVQSLSRSLFARIIPKEQSGEFFGFYNLLGKSAAIIGPFLVGTVALLTGNPRISILSVSLLLAAGALCLHAVDEREGERLAAELDG